MSLIGCTGVRLTDALLQTIAESIRDDAPQRLERILKDSAVSAEDINRKSLLHQATWLGYTECIKVILAHGADPNYPHRKNGCPALHLAHFCTVEETNPHKTIDTLISAGAKINALGSKKCGKTALLHAIQHQRTDTVKILIKHHASIQLNSVHVAIDVANPNILEMLLLSGGSCGKSFSKLYFWGTALERVFSTPVKCPKAWYKNMFKMVTEASVSVPIKCLNEHFKREWEDSQPTLHLSVENKLSTIAQDYVELAVYLFIYLVRNGYKPNAPVCNYVSSIHPVPWIPEYLNSVPSLKDLSVRVLRSHLACGGNILHGIEKLLLPSRVTDLILFRYDA